MFTTKELCQELASAAIDAILISFWMGLTGVTMLMSGSYILGPIFLLVSFLNARTAQRRFALRKQIEVEAEKKNGH